MTTGSDTIFTATAMPLDQPNKQPVVSLVELKRLARKNLPRNSLLRKILETEPDILPRQQGLAKVELYVKLFHEEQERPL